MRLTIVVGAGVLAIAFAQGCKRHGPAAATSATCEEIAAKGSQVRVQGKAPEAMTESQRRNAALIGGRVKAALLQACQDDAWSPALRACVGAIKPGDAPAPCEAMLTPTQRDHVAAAMRRAYADSQQAVVGDMVDLGTTMLGVLGAVAAAGGSRPEPTCEAIAAVSLKDDGASEIGWVKAQAAANAALLARLCTEDGWSRQAIACSMADDKVAICTDQLTPAQLQRLGLEACKLNNPTLTARCEELQAGGDAGAAAK